MFLRIAVTYIVIFTVFYIVLALYERFIKKINISDTDRVFYVAFGTAAWPLTIIFAIIYCIVQLVNNARKF